jgi:phosphonate transport system substrate-binding protein
MLRKSILAFAAMTLMSSTVLAKKVEPLNFGIISTESSTNLKAAWQPVIDDLSKAIGIEVKPFFASDYAGIIEGMRFNQVQLGWFGNKSAMEAVDRAQGEVFASVIDKDGNPGYWSVLMVQKDGGLKTLDDVLKSKQTLSYGAGDPNSTSGTLVPTHFLWNPNNIDPKTFFKTVRAANHEINLLSVINKQVDVAIANTEALERYKRNTGKDAKESINVIWTSPLIPADPLVMRADLPADVKKNIQTFFVNYGKGANAQSEQEKLAKLTYKGFRESNNDQLIPIRQMELAKVKAAIQGDTSLSAADKQAKVAALDKQLAELDKAAQK